MVDTDKKRLFKIVLLGDGGVGKTSLIHRFVSRTFYRDYKMTIGSDLLMKEVQIGEYTVKLQIWDIAGQARFKFLQKSFYRGSAGAVLVFDLSSKNTFDPQIMNWLDNLHEGAGKVPVVLVGNKVDLSDNREIPQERAEEIAKKLTFPYLETSAKTGENVDALFHQIAVLMLKNEGVEVDFEHLKEGEVKVVPTEAIGEMAMGNKWGVEPTQAEILSDLEKLIGQDLPRVDELTWQTLGVTVKGGKLIGLSLYDCRLTTVPTILMKLTTLQELRIYSNGLMTLPEFMFGFKSLQILGLGNNQLEHLPKALGNLKSLKTLSLKENKLVDLPESICDLESLEYLNLMGNQVAALPEKIGKLKSLQKLDLSGNELKSLPKSFGQLKELQEIDLSTNKLEALPEDIGYLHVLENFNLYFNQLKELPPSFQALRSLKVLNLSYNQLSVMPESLLELEGIQFIGLKRNQLKSLPLGLWRMRSLEDIELEGNPWEGEWDEVVKNDVPTIFDFCRKRDTITVFCSHAEADFHSNLIKIEKIAKYLRDQEEIYKVYYSEEAIQGGMSFEEFMRKNVPISHALLFFATKKSLKSKPCQFELQLALDNQIPIIPILGPNLKWDNLNQISLSEPTGEPFQLAEVKGLNYLDNVPAFGAELYQHIHELKRAINLFDKEEMRIDQVKLEFAELFTDFIKSSDYNKQFKENFDRIAELFVNFKKGSISFPTLVKNLFEIIE